LPELPLASTQNLTIIRLHLDTPEYNESRRNKFYMECFMPK